MKSVLTFNQLKKLVLEAEELESSSDVPEFEIDKDGTLTKYNGPGGDVVIPHGVKKIGVWFADKEYDIEGGRIRLLRGYHGAFEHRNIVSVKLPNGLTEIGRLAFNDCINLEKINFPNTLKTIGDHAFAYCRSLKKINLPDSLVQIENNAFDMTGIEHVIIPASVETIYDNAFGPSTRRAVVKNPHTYISKNAFDEKTKVVKAEGNKDTLVAQAVRQLLTPSGDSKCGRLEARTWRRMDDSVFARVTINHEDYELNTGEAKEFGDKVRQGVVSAGGMVLKSETYAKKYGSWYSSYSDTIFSIPTQARKFEKPCHEWEILSKIAEKYANFKLDPMKCRYGDASGKRGHLDSPEEWQYIAFDHSDWIRKTIDKLRAVKTLRDTLKVEPFKAEDCEDRDYSERYETECYGSMINTYKFSVITPGGKLKSEIILSPSGGW